MIYEAILLPVILFHHSNLRIPPWLDRVLSLVIVTPSLHRIHHSPDHRETDSNYASVLSLWDRLARTRVVVRGAAQPRYGLLEFDAVHSERLAVLLAIPFRAVPRAGPARALVHESTDGGS